MQKTVHFYKKRILSGEYRRRNRRRGSSRIIDDNVNINQLFEFYSIQEMQAISKLSIDGKFRTEGSRTAFV